MAAPVIIGGVGTALSLEDVLEVAAGAPVSLDTAVLERIKKESPSPAAFKPEDAETAKAADDSATAAAAAAAAAASSPASSSPSVFLLTETEARSAVLARLLSLANGSTRVRPAVLQFLAEGLLNSGVTPRLPTTRSSLSSNSDENGGDAAPLAAVAAAASSGAGATLSSSASSSETTVGRALAACGSSAGPPGLSAEERAALTSGRAAAAGVAAAAAAGASRLSRAANGVAALTADALRLDGAKLFGSGAGDDAAASSSSSASASTAALHPGAAAAAAELRGLLAGSRAAASLPRPTGPGSAPPRPKAPAALLAAPAAHGAIAAALVQASAAARAELRAPATAPAKGGGGGGGKAGAADGNAAAKASGPPALELASSQLFLARALLVAASLAVARREALEAALAELGGAGGGEKAGAGEGNAADSSSSSPSDAIAAASRAVADADLAVLSSPTSAPALGAALAASAAVRALSRALGAEAAAALAVVAALEAAEEREKAKVAAEKKAAAAEAEAEAASTAAANGESAAAAAAADGKKPAAAPKKKGGPPPRQPFGLGRGTAALASYLSTPSSSPTDLLSPTAPGLPATLALLRAAAEANAPRRRPKIAKGTRDFLPDQMRIRKKALQLIEGVFESHGAVSIDTPVFELRETLTGKYGEDSKLIYDLADQGGEALSLRYDLTVPFARFVALHGVGNIKRYHIGKVYRRDQPAMSRGRFREFFQCDFDVAGSYGAGASAAMAPDAEVLKVLTDVLDALGLDNHEIKLNHRGLLDGGLAAAGVPAAKFKAACSAIDKLDKEPWEAVRRELVDQKGIAEDVADRVRELVSLRGGPRELVARLREAGSPVFARKSGGGADASAAAAAAAAAAAPGEEEAIPSSSSSDAASAKALDELEALASSLEALGVTGNRIVLDLSLARGLDYYTGVIYEAVLHNEKVGSIAAGGRYDGLVGMFSGADVPAVGVSVGVERVFAILEGRARAAAAASGGRIRESETSVLVCSVGKGLQAERMRVAAELWAAGVAAEFGYKPDPNLKDQLRAADELGVPFVCLIGKEEVEGGTVKLKNMRAGTEETLPRGEKGTLGRAVAERVRKEAAEAEAEAAAAAGEPGASSSLSSSLVAAGRGAKMASAASGDGGAQS